MTETMTRSSVVWVWRLGAALAITAAAAPAAAQSVIVRNAPPGAAVEVVLNGEPPRTAAADSSGDAMVAAGFPSTAEEVDVRFAIDVCAAAVRVYINSAGAAPAAAAGCTRTALPDLFAMRRVTTFLVEIEAGAPTLHLTQGPPPPSWLGAAQAARAARRPFQPPPSVALLANAGLGIAKFGKAISSACGDLAACRGDDVSGAASVGATVWVKRFLGGQVTLVRPGQATATGSGDNFRFSTTLDTRLVTVAALVGVRTSGARLYGLVGTNRHQATLLTTETFNDVTSGTGDAAVTTPGGTQTFEHRTEGWNWVFGGGVEAFPVRRVGFFVEMQRATLKATEPGSTDGGIDDRVTLVMAGLRLRLF